MAVSFVIEKSQLLMPGRRLCPKSLPALHRVRWRLARRFKPLYNGRDVCHGIQRIEALRESDPEVDLLVSDLKHEPTSMDANTREITDETSDSIRADASLSS
jgi:hypothetical protein